MNFIPKLVSCTTIACLLAYSQLAAAGTETQPTTTSSNATSADSTLDNHLTMSAMATKAWLEGVDKGKYGESWDNASQLMRGAIKRNEWIKDLTKLRQPLGEVKSRTVLDQRTAKDPKNLPKGDYMVMFYNTAFANKPVGYELVTLYLESDGQWRVVTYQID